MTGATPPTESEGARPREPEPRQREPKPRRTSDDADRATGRVVVAGDVHLGAETADADSFDAFLATLYRDRDELDEVVLLGDVWDLVRRDPFGVALETAGTLESLARLSQAVPVTYVLGNHDVHLQGLDDARYDLAFRDEYTFEQAGTRIHVRHGNDFDALQSNRLSRYLSGPGDRGEIDPTRGLKDSVVARVRDAVGGLKRGFRSRLRTDGGSPVPSYPRRERRAHEYLATIADDKLVYGHTHAPYVHHENLAANPGSWKTTAPVSNTYVEVVDGRLALYEFRPDRADRRLA